MIADNMNLQLKEITLTKRDGKVSHLDQVFIRGSQGKLPEITLK